MHKILIMVIALGLMACTYVGKKDATWVQQFYEVDQAAIAALEVSTAAIVAVNEREIVVPKALKTTLKVQASVLGTTRYQVRSWVDACEDELRVCPPEDRIRLGIESMVAATAVVRSVVREVYEYGG
jgi:hypothetical protein